MSKSTMNCMKALLLGFTLHACKNIKKVIHNKAISLAGAKIATLSQNKISQILQLYSNAQYTE